MKEVQSQERKEPTVGKTVDTTAILFTGTAPGLKFVDKTLLS
jgi:hypothetical protein